MLEEGTSNATISNQQGQYKLQVLNDEASIRFNHIGYQTLITKTSTLVDPVEMHRFSSNMPTAYIQSGRIIQDSFFSVGTGSLISAKMLNQFYFTDISRVLPNIPGVNIQEEDGFGLRPNIGLRGSGSSRSSKITLMEDGILMAPAPYAAPAAYYFPTMGRMSGIEILKGSSQIPYGPNTTGGAINLISSPLTTQRSAELLMQTGSFNTTTVHGRFSNSHKGFSYLAQFYQYSSNGFKHINKVYDSGFKKSDFLIKMGYIWGGDVKNSVQVKWGSVDESSNETYLGLSTADYESDPYQRYLGTSLDHFKSNHQQLSLSHQIQTKKGLEIQTQVYANTFERNWFKLDKVADSIGKTFSLSNALLDPFTLEVLKGQNAINGNLYIKANNRSYYSRGIQSNASYRFNRSSQKRFTHTSNLGLRFHQDGMDRFQWVDRYSILEKNLTLFSAGAPGTESNLLLDAEAFSGYVQHQVKSTRWQINPGVRFEHIRIYETNYGKLDPERSGVAQEQMENITTAVLPGIGFRYQTNAQYFIMGGIHRGFSPPGVDSAAKSELSTNSELGVEAKFSKVQAKLVVFHTHYNNLLGTDLAANGGSGSLQMFNGGAAQAYGVEWLLGFQGLEFNKHHFRFPIQLTYTFTEAQFLTNFDSDFEAWGKVQDGDELPYISKHQAALMLQAVGRRLTVSINNRFTSAMRLVAGSDDLSAANSIQPNYLCDLNFQVLATDRTKLLVSINNLLNNTYLASSWPAGHRPGMPRFVQLGFKMYL